MRKFQAYLIIILLGLQLSACGGGSSDTSDGTTVIGQDGTTVIGQDGTTVIAQKEIALTWTAPTTRANGTYLEPTELAGYRIYYGTSREKLEPLVDIEGYWSMERTISVPSTGIYYFAVTAYDLDGLESTFSEIVSKEAS